MPGPILIILVVVTLVILWIVGEAADKPLVRRISGPLAAIAIAMIAAGVAVLDTGFTSSIHYSEATKEFVAALVAAIDRGDTDQAHEELRRFDNVSIVTYEGGAFVKWLEESADRLADGSAEAALPAEPQPAGDASKDPISLDHRSEPE